MERSIPTEPTDGPSLSLKKERTMPKWAIVLVVIAIIWIFVLPNPGHAGAAFGSIIGAIITFLRSFAYALSGPGPVG